MELCDVERLQSIPDGTLRGLAQRLKAIGLAPPLLARLARVGERLDDALRAPMRVWNARRMREPGAVAARLFLLHDAVEPSEAREALGDLGALMAAGLLEEASAGVVSRVHVAIAGDLYCLGDRPGAGAEAVLPVCGATLELARAAMPRAPVESALDLGCGAGAVGLLLARAARRVVATDVSARAVAFARVNARLNGVGHVEHRQGDLYETVRGERFDRIAAHPPFLARREGVAASAFLHGGRRGDELSLRVVGGAAGHLSAGGRAVVAGDWPLVDGDALEARVRAAVDPVSSGARGAREGAPVDVLVLACPSKNLDEYCAMHAAVEHPELGAAFASEAIAQRDHLERLALRGIAFAVVVLQPARGGAGWTSSLPVRNVHDSPVGADTLDRLLAARTLAFGPKDALAAARLRLPEGARGIEQPMPGGEPPSIVIHLPAGRPEWPIVLDASTAAVVDRIARSPRVLDAACGAEASAVLRIARDALLRGALEASS